ncbi:hypothetical protein [Dongia sp. agr-C8]
MSEIDPDSGVRQGLYHAVARLRESPDISPADCDLLDEVNEWFNKNLEKPTQLSISRRPHGKAQAISWFKASAVAHIQRMHQFASVLKSYDIAVEMITSRRPGYIVYEDEFQIAAYPFKDTAT